MRAHFAQAAHCEKTALKIYVDPNNCKKLRAEVLDFLEADLDRGACGTHEFTGLPMPLPQPPRLSTASMNSSIGEPTPLALREQRAEQMRAAQCSSKRHNRNTRMDSRMILTNTPATNFSKEQTQSPFPANTPTEFGGRKRSNEDLENNEESDGSEIGMLMMTSLTCRREDKSLFGLFEHSKISPVNHFGRRVRKKRVPCIGTHNLD